MLICFSLDFVLTALKRSSDIRASEKRRKSHLWSQWDGGIHSPVHSNSSKREHWDVDGDWLDEEHQITHGAAKHPTVWVECISKSEGHTGHTHEHVGEGQVSDEEVGHVVHLARAADDVQEQVIPKDPHHHNEHVAGDDEGLERLQQSHICKLRAAVGGAVLHGHLVYVSICTLSCHRWMYASSQAALINLHGSRDQAVSTHTVQIWSTKHIFSWALKLFWNIRRLKASTLGTCAKIQQHPTKTGRDIYKVEYHYCVFTNTNTFSQSEEEVHYQREHDYEST